MNLQKDNCTLHFQQDEIEHFQWEKKKKSKLLRAMQNFGRIFTNSFPMDWIQLRPPKDSYDFFFFVQHFVSLTGELNKKKKNKVTFYVKSRTRIYLVLRMPIKIDMTQIWTQTWIGMSMNIWTVNNRSKLHCNNWQNAAIADISNDFIQMDCLLFLLHFILY